MAEESGNFFRVEAARSGAGALVALHLLAAAGGAGTPPMGVTQPGTAWQYLTLDQARALRDALDLVIQTVEAEATAHG